MKSDSQSAPPGAAGARVARRWLRVLAWTAAALAAGVVVAGLAIWLLLVRTGRLQRFVLQEVRTQAATRLGAPVEIGNLALHWGGGLFSNLAPSVDLYGVVVPGAAPYQNPPLLRLDRLHVAIRITSLWRRRWYLSDLEADHPVVWYWMDAAGRSNVPDFSGGGSSAPGSSVFDLGVRRALVRDGAVYANSRRYQVAGEVDNLGLESRFETSTRTYAGSLSYSGGRIQYDGMAAAPHALALDFAAAPGGVRISRLTLVSGDSRIEASGSLTNYAQPVIAAQYQARLDAGQLGAELREPGIPAGVVAVSGRLEYAGAVSAAGEFSSARLLLREGNVVAPVTALAGHYQFAHDNLEVATTAGQLLGGALRVALSVEGMSTRGAARLQVGVRGAHLEQVAAQASGLARRPLPLGAVGVSGAGDFSATANWGRGFPDAGQVEVVAEAAVNAALIGAAAQPIPITAEVNARYLGATQQLGIERATVRTPSSWLSADGTLAANAGTAALGFQFQSIDLRQLEAMADRVGQAWPGAQLPQLGLGGAAQLRGTLKGNLSAPQFAGQLAATNLAVRGTRWRSASATVAASPDEVRVTDARLQGASTRVDFSLGAGLADWSLRDTSPVEASVSVTGLALEEVAGLLGRPLPVSGTVAAHFAVHGSEQHPEGQGSITLAQAAINAGGVHESVTAATLRFEGTGNAVQGTLSATLPAGAVTGSGTFFPQRRAYSAALHADGIALNRLWTGPVSGSVSGTVSLDGSGQGTLANPGFEATLTAPRLVVEKQAITGLDLKLGLANHSLQAQLAAGVAQTQVQGQATVALTGDYLATAKLDTQVIPLAPLLALYAPAIAGNVAGTTEIHASLQGPLKNLRQLQAHLLLPSLQLHYDANGASAVELAATAPVQLDLAGGLLVLRKTGIRGTDTELQLAGTFPLVGAASTALSVVAQGRVNLALLHAFDPDLASAGELDLDLHSAGGWSNPTAAGEVRIVNASLGSDAIPAGLQDGNGVLRLGEDRLGNMQVSITSFHGTVGGGAVTASGAVALTPALRFNLALAAHQVRLLYPANVREALDGQLTLTGSLQQAYLNGRIQLASLEVTPQFDVTNFVSEVSGNGVSVTAPGSFNQDLALNLAITTPNQINTHSRDFSLQANANLTVRGTADAPVVLGRVSLNSGDMIFRGNRYVLQSGSLDFVNPNLTEPVVNFSADTTIQQYDLHLHFQGPASNLQTSYTSDPALPPSDIINLLAFGQTSEASAANPLPASLSAENLVASAISGQITDRVQKIAGISQLSVDPVLGGAQQNADAQITIQQRVTGNLFVTFSADVAGEYRDVVEIQYQLTPKVSVGAIRDQNGGIGVNARLKKTW